MNIEVLLKIKNIYNNIPNEVKKARKSFFNNGNRANRLYIYYGIDDIKKTANEDKKLWFKSPKMYGDKEENNAWMSKFFHVIIEIENKKYCKKFKEIVNNAFATYDIKEYYNKYYVCCLSYKPDNNLCWNTFGRKTHYNLSKIKIGGENIVRRREANNEIVLTGKDLSCSFDNEKFRSACICFDKTRLDIDLNKNLFIYGFVSYSSQILTQKFFDALKSVYKEYKENNDDCYATYIIKKLIDYCNLFYKNKYYAGEKEYRYVYDSTCDTNSGNNLLHKELENGELVYKYRFEEKAVDHITVTNLKDKQLFKDYKVKLSKIAFNQENIDFLKENVIFED